MARTVGEKLKRKQYEKELEKLQVELCHLQDRVKTTGERIIIALELFHGGEEAPGETEAHGETWPLAMTIGVMAVVTLLIVWMSEILVGTVEHASKALGLSNLFVGVVVVAVVGNAAEHSTAVPVAMRNRMELAIGIAIGNSTQIALFVAPLLVLLSLVMAPAPLSTSPEREDTILMTDPFRD